MKIVLEIESSHSTREDRRDLATELVKAKYQERDYEPTEDAAHLLEVVHMSLNEAEMRKKYKIPSHYHYWGKMVNGTHHFSYCDSDIDVYDDGRCTESHWATTLDGSYLHTSEWPSST